MEEKLVAFIAENQEVRQLDDTDGSVCFVRKQILTLAQDCLEKSRLQLLSSLYFHELSENLRTLSLDVRLPYL